MKLVRKQTTVYAFIAIFGLNLVYFVCRETQASSAVYLKESSQRDEESRAVEELKRLGIPLQEDSHGDVRWIEATNGELDDEAMHRLPSLSKLEWLEVGGGKVTTAGIASLKNCPALKRLYIHDINLAGDDLAWLSSLTKLEALSLQRTGIDGGVLKNLKATDSLVVLNLSGDKIVDSDMDQVARIKGLEVLALADTKITGSGIATLEGMSRLNELNVMHCAIEDPDLDYFLSMPNLRIVFAEGCNISDFGVQTTVVKFPMLAIFR
jgi:Leucine-rich repeat (LRR) protein